MDLEIFKKLCAASKIRWTIHGMERLQERGISREDIINCIMNGEIIEEYPNDFPNPSALIFGYNIDGQIIHTVCGTDNSFVYVITAYFPNEDKFLDDLKTRRKK